MDAADETRRALVASRLSASGALAPGRESAFPDASTFCLLPWTGASVHPDGTVVPCCFAEPGPGFGSAADLGAAWNAPALKALRLDLLNGRRAPACSLCWEREDAGLPSLRTATRGRNAGGDLPGVGLTAADGSAPAGPLSLELRFSNLCNLKCRWCGPHFSSAWHEDAKAMDWPELGPALRKAPAGLLSQVEALLPRLSHIELLGGEPLLMDEHLELLDLLLARGRTDISLGCSTNFTTLRHRGRSIPELWSRFRRVSLRLSLDAAGARGEYLRSGLRWDEVAARRAELRAGAPQAHVQLFATVGALNLLSLPELLEQWLRLPAAQGDRLVISALTRPEPYSVRVLPPALKAEGRARLEAFLRREKDALGDRFAPLRAGADELLAYMDSKDETGLLPEMRRQTRRLDELRGEHFGATFPELETLF